MKNILLCLITGLTLIAKAETLDAQIDTHLFMQKIKGNYEVVSVNGIKPHTNNPAEVSIEDPENAEWSMPYCSSDSCLPGFISFNYSNTQVFEEISSPGVSKYLIVLNENGTVKNFIWREENSRIFFRNPQYLLPGGKVIDLEHELKRLSID